VYQQYLAANGGRNPIFEQSQERSLFNQTHNDPLGTDIARGIGNGPFVAASNTADLFSRAGGDPGYDTMRPFGEPKGVAGGIAEGISTYLTGVAVMGGNPAAGIPGFTGFAARTLVTGGISFAAFKSDTGRLSDLITQNLKGTPADNIVTQYLSTHEDDTAFESRLKGALENMGIDAAFSLISKGAKYVRGVKTAKDATEALAVASKLGPDLKMALQDFQSGVINSISGEHINSQNLPQVLVATGTHTPAEAQLITKFWTQLANEKGLDLNDLIKSKLGAIVRSGDAGPTLESFGPEAPLPWQDGQLAGTQAAGEGTTLSKADITQARDIGKHVPPTDTAATPQANAPAPTGELGVKAGMKIDKAVASVRQLAEIMDRAVPMKGAKPDMIGDSAKFLQASVGNPAKGMIQFINTGRAVITLFRDADVTTFSHEMAHLVRANLSDAEQTVLENAYGSKRLASGFFPGNIEEQFARDIEAKIFKGKVINPEIDNAISPVAHGVVTMYQHLADNPGGIEPSNALKDWFGKSAEVSRAVVLGTADENTTLASKLLKSLDGPTPSYSREATGVNMFTYDVSDPVDKIMAAGSRWGEQYVKPLIKTLDQTKGQAEQRLARFTADSGITMSDVTNYAKAIGKKATNLDVSTAELKYITDAMTNKITDLAKMVRGGSQDAIVDFSKAVDQYGEFMGVLRGYQKSVGRAVNAFKITPSAEKSKMLQELLSTGGARKAVDLAADISTMDSMGTLSFRKLHQAILGNRFWSTLLELRYGAMLSGPSGALADSLSNTLKTALTPIEKIIGGTLRGVSTGDYTLAREGVGIYVGLAHSVNEALRSTWQALRTGEAILDPHLEGGPAKAITASNYGLDKTIFGPAIDYLGKAVRLPSVVRMSGDEFFKNWNYRAFLYSQFTREGMDSGLRGDGLAQFIASKLTDVTDDLGRGKFSGALRYAQEQTFATPFRSAFGNQILAMAQKYPALRLVLPFIKTPANIFKDVVAHTPLVGAALKETREAFAMGGNARADVLGKWATGSMFYLSAYFAAQRGMLTGGGGPDAGVAASKRIGGWQPYSLQIGNKYYAYNRLDPVGAFLGLAADFHETTPYMTGGEGEQAAAAMLISFNKVLLSKTYLKGLNDVLQAMNDPTPGMQKYLRGMVTSFEPQAFNTINQDPYVREAHSLMEAVARKAPYASESLDPKRNVLGEPIDKYKSAFLGSFSPIGYSEVSSDPVKRELASLSKAFRNPDPIEQGTDLSAVKLSNGQSAYDRRLELIGSVKLGGKTIHDTLDRLVKSRTYQAMIGAGDSLLEQRQVAVEGVLASYRQAALMQLLKENPKLREQMHQARVVNATGQAASLKAALMQLKQQANP
jgi:hypothetical protein